LKKKNHATDMPEITFERAITDRVDSVGHELEATLRDIGGASRSFKSLTDAEVKGTLKASTNTLKSFQHVADTLVPLMLRFEETQGKLNDAIDETRDDLSDLARYTKNLMVLVGILIVIAILSLAFR
jgi:ABC-type transporter Mla subunit MlaD